MIGYLVSRELGNRLGNERPIAVLLTMIEVDPADPAFSNPTKPIGPFYDAEAAEMLSRDRGWDFEPDGDAYRRVVPSPKPKRVVELDQIKALLDGRAIVVCAGGGGIPTMADPAGNLHGIEAVVDKDYASELLAEGIGADRFLMATDVDAVYVNWREPNQAAIARAHPDAMEALAPTLPAGSMRPKVLAAVKFVRATGQEAMIGTLTQVAQMLQGTAGTIVTNAVDGVEHHPPAPADSR